MIFSSQPLKLKTKFTDLVTLVNHKDLQHKASVLYVLQNVLLVVLKSR